MRLGSKLLACLVVTFSLSEGFSDDKIKAESVVSDLESSPKVSSELVANGKEEQALVGTRNPNRGTDNENEGEIGSVNVRREKMAKPLMNSGFDDAEKQAKNPKRLIAAELIKERVKDRHFKGKFAVMKELNDANFENLRDSMNGHQREIKRQDGHGSARLTKGHKHLKSLPHSYVKRRQKRSPQGAGLIPVTDNPTRSPSKVKTDEVKSVKMVVPVCSLELSCQNRCGSPRPFSLEDKLTCYCDNDCLHFYDCCADFARYCHGSNSTTRSQNVSQVSQRGLTPASDAEVAPHWGPWKCFPWMNSIQLMPGSHGVWMVGTCPRLFQDQRCTSFADSRFQITRENLVDTLPVYSSNGTVYRNRFCARCHGIPTSELQTYGVYFNCETTPSDHLTNEQKMDYLLRYCANGMTWKTKEDQPRRFCLKVPQTCDVTATREEYYKCVNGDAGVVFEGFTNYKNIHCTACSRLYRDIKCGPRETSRPGGFIPAVAPFSMVFNFGGSKRTLKTASTTIRCPFRHVYDPYLEACRAYAFIPNPTPSVFDEYRILLWLRIYKRLSTSTANLQRQFKGTLSKAFSINPKDISNVVFTGVFGLKFMDQYKLYFDVRVNGTSSERSRRSLDTKLSINQVLYFQAPFNLTLNGAIFTAFKATKRILKCVNLQKYERHEYTVLSKPKSAVYLNNSGAVIQSKDYYTNESGIILVCHNRLTTVANCSGEYVAMEDTEFIVLSNKSIYVNASKESFHPYEYISRNGSIWICRNFSKTYKKAVTKGKEDRILVIITFFCMLLSIVALVFFLITYMLFSELRTPPGINLMNLCTAILLAQLLWIIGSRQPEAPKACTAIAVLLHYLFLVSFIWTSIIAFDTWRAFAYSHQRASPSAKKKLIQCLRHMVVGWLPALLFVGIFTALDQSGIVAIGYGSSVACWITNGMALLYVFAIPVGLVLVFNLVFYVLTIRAIKATTNQTRMAAEDAQTRRHFGIYVRIAAVMGFQWIFGFLAVFAWLPLWYVFVVFSCLQGVYIAAAFALSERARNLYKGLISRTKLPGHKKLDDVSSSKQRSRVLTMDSPLPSRSRELDTRL